MMFKSIICLLSLLSTFAYGAIRHPHEHFIQKHICIKLSEHQYDSFNFGMKLKCEWPKFLDENMKLISSKQSFRDSEFIYDIVFTPSAVPSEMQRYKTIPAGLFSNFRLNTVSFQSLGIVRVEEGAFDKFCCENTLETLDLSKNVLVRLDAETLVNLRRLTRLNLSQNRIALSEHNFKHLRNLRYVDLSLNNLQFLPSHLFTGVSELELANFSGNDLRNVDSCIFDKVQLSPLARSLFPTKIDLSGNPIHCDCDVFYLARHRSYNLVATCVSPAFYNGKQFTSLTREDPSARCDYKKMEASCEVDNAQLLFCLVVTFGILASLFFVCCLTCCCKYMGASDKAERLEKSLETMRRVDRSAGNGKAGDRVKLLA